MKTIEVKCDFCGRLINNYYRLRLRNFLRFLLSLFMTRLSVKYVEKWEGTRYALDLCPQCYSTTKNVFQDKNTINELHDLCRQNAMRPPQQRYEARIDWGGTETARTYAEAGQEAPTGTTR